MTKKKYQSMFQQKLQLDQETKQKLKSFAPQMEEWKNKPVEESEFARTVVCGEKEFKKPKSPKSLKS
jgi:hypothetical protein